MVQIDKFWRKWVYDSSNIPIVWSCHPHEAFRIGARLAAAILGSVVPFGTVLIYSGVLGKLDDGARLGPEFYVAALVFVAVWLISIIGVANAEEKSIPKYIFLASVGPANLVLVYQIIQWF